MWSDFVSLNVVISRNCFPWGEFRQYLNSFVNKLIEHKAYEQQVTIDLSYFLQVWKSLNSEDDWQYFRLINFAILLCTELPRSWHCRTRFSKMAPLLLFGYITTGEYPKCLKCLAATKPSPPLLPGPEVICRCSSYEFSNFFLFKCFH